MSMQKRIFLPLLLCALTGFGATQSSPKSIKPWINDDKIRDSIDDVIKNDELAIGRKRRRMIVPPAVGQVPEI